MYNLQKFSYILGTHNTRAMCLSIFVCFLYCYLMVYNHTVILHVQLKEDCYKTWHYINIYYINIFEIGWKDKISTKW